MIPIFCKHFNDWTTPTIYGDGLTNRDFTFVENAIQADIKAFELVELLSHEVCNVACGDQVSLNETIWLLAEISGKDIQPTYGSERKGDVKYSKASTAKITCSTIIPSFVFNKVCELPTNVIWWGHKT